MRSRRWCSTTPFTPVSRNSSRASAPAGRPSWNGSWVFGRRKERSMHRIAPALLLTAASTRGFAQSPAKPIRFIVGFPPGGSADPTTRIVGQALSDQMGQPVIVDNRPGADSTLAAEQMTRIAPDGYTIMFGSNSAMTAPVALRKSPPYDPLKDFTPISLVGRATDHVRPSLGARQDAE